jgi:cytochrome c biogenesis protein
VSSSQRSKSRDEVIESPEIGIQGWARWFWRQLTSMRTALLLLLLLAAAAIPGSVYPQRSADPNGVTAFFDNEPELAKILDAFQIFDVYTSTWFSAIYILLFVSLIGCVVPRTRVHYDALRAAPPAAPKNFARMPANKTVKSRRANIVLLAEMILRKQGYRVSTTKTAVSAERGYLRETGNLIFHFSLIGVLISVGIGGGLSYSGQRVLIEGETFVNNLAGYDSISPGTFFSEKQLTPFSVTLDKFNVIFDIRNQTNIGTPLDFKANVTSKIGAEGKPTAGVIRVNEPLELPNANLYLTGNGYAPVITVRDADGNVSFSGPTAFLPQDKNYTSLGVYKLPDAKPKQFGMISFFYPTAEELSTGAKTSIFPDPINPLLTLNVYEGDLGLDGGVPKNVYSLDISKMKQVAGGKSGVKGIELQKGETAKLPNGLGTVKFEGIKRFISMDISYNPGAGFILLFALLSLGGLVLSLLVPRRRVWVRKTADGFELAALARGDDPTLEKIIDELAIDIKKAKLE